MTELPSICHGSSLESTDIPATLGEVLQQAAQTKTGIRYLRANGTESFQSYKELLEQAQCILGGLRELGLTSQDIVILQLQDSQDFLSAFWACLLGGFVPVPTAAAPNYTADNSKANALNQILQLVKSPTILSDWDLARVIQSFVSLEEQTVPIESLKTHKPDQSFYRGQPDELALLLPTSGSTGTPKGVMLSARNLLVSAYGMSTVNCLSRRDITLNWMPLEHVASLVMFHFTEVYLGCQQIHVANEIVLQNPLKWLDLIEHYRVTATWAPNFAYGLVNEQAETIRQRHWDLSSIRWMGNGAEAVVGQTTRRFLELLAPHNLATATVSPGYGMSETCSGIVHSHQFSLESDKDAFVEVGSPIPGLSVRVVDEQHRLVEEGTVGLVQVKGATVTSGYYQRPDLNAEVFTEDGWFNTGDLGFLQEKKLTITGRQKEAIVINGTNCSNHDIEAAVEELSGVEVSYTAACSVRERSDATERLAIFFSSSTSEDKALLELLKAVRRKVISTVGVSPDYLIPVAQAEIPKTVIGKIQRRQLSQRFEAGEFDAILQRVDRLVREHTAAGQDLPHAGLEQQIAQIWEDVLNITSVGIHDNFFELGGNSLRLMQVLHHLQEQLGQSISVVDLFQSPTIETLAQHLSQETSQTRAVPPIRQGGRQENSAGIAVVGMACQFPGAKNLDEFWQNLRDGVESISFFTDEEILASGVDASLLQRPNYVKAGSILEDVESFDADFFGYSPREAELMDPQQRLLLECAWESLEHSGYDPLTYPGAIGLYAGASMNTYLLNHVYPSRQQLDPNENLQVVTLGSMGGFQMTVANDKDYLTTRVSYKLNLRGPSVNVQTACSTSLVAIHMAAQSVLGGECDMALAGGVSVHTPQKVGHLFQEGMILSPDGHCRAFDARAQGTLFGSGVGMVVLKRLEEAIADRDSIYAVIKGSAVGNDGNTKVGYLAPRVDGQATVAAQAMAAGKVEADTISYVEAHGTGTELGDPIEIAGLTQAFRASTQERQFCAIGSVKSNVGHLNIASGVVGFIKTALSLHHQKLPPSLHFEAPNPRIEFANSPFYVNTALSEWSAERSPRRAGVNSLGIGGTNVHVVLEEAPELTQRTEPEPEHPVRVLTLSAKHEDALQALAKRYEQFLASHPEVAWSDICFTANVGRSHFDHRLAVVANAIAPAREALQAFQTGGEAKELYRPASGGQPAKIAFLFPAQGSHYNVGHQLYETQPIFQEALDRCDAIWRSHFGLPLLDVIYPSPEQREGTRQQPALFALEYALYQLWISWGIIPSAVMGHGIGEYAAACAAGVFSLEAALKLIAARGRFMQVTTPNARSASLAEFEQVAREISYSQPRREIISQVTGRQATEAIATPEYWCHHLHSCEQSVAGMETLTQLGYSLFLACDPYSSSTGAESYPLRSSQLWLPSLRPNQPDWQSMLESLCELYVRGAAVDWHNVNLGTSQQRIALPSYPFQRQRHWIEPPQPEPSRTQPLEAAPSHSAHPLLGRRQPTALKEILFESRLSRDTPTFLRDHRVNQQIILPGTAYLEMALAAGANILKTTAIQIQNVVIPQALVLPQETIQLVQCILCKEATGASFQIYSLPSEQAELADEGWVQHCTGEIAWAEPVKAERIDLAQLQRQFVEARSPLVHDQDCQARGIEYGPSFKMIQKLWGKPHEALGLMQVPDTLVPELSAYQIHPALLDACFQVILAALPPATQPATYLPVSLESFHLYHPPGQQVWSHVQLHPLEREQPATITADIRLYDDRGTLVGQVSGLSAQRVSPAALFGTPEPSWQEWLYEVEWHSQARPHQPARQSKGKWLILADSRGIAQQLAQHLKAQNQICTIAVPGAQYQRVENQIDINPDRRDDFQQLLATVREDGIPLEGVVHLWSLDTAVSQSQENPDLLKASRWGCQSALYLVQALLEQSSSRPHLWFVTQEAQPVHLSEPSPSGIAQSPLWGMGKTLGWEDPEWYCSQIDLDRQSPEASAQTLFDEIWSADAEEQVIFRGGTRYVARLGQQQSGRERSHRQTWQLHVPTRGSLDELEWRVASRREPAPGELEVRVRATGLNFRDVLNALDMYPGDAGSLGLECAGEVVTVGEGVQEFEVGDAVIANAQASFSQHVTVNAALVVPKPDALSFEEAATIPVAFLTAYYALHQLGKIKAGDRILIHAAAGGVGQAAVQIAQQSGAEVFATASASKWEFLKSLGVQHVMNSRSLDFADAIAEMTQGEGVDLVLNSLSGDFIPQSLSVLKAKGRFLEIGKAGVWQPEQIAELKPDVAYSIIDLIQVSEQQPQLIQSMLKELMQQFQPQSERSRSLQPLPCKTFSSPQVQEAFRFMQQARQIGKIAIAQETGESSVPEDSDGAYLITGGLGGLGLQVARWLVERGARHLLIVGRRQPSAEAQATLKQLERAGAAIRVFQADVSKLDELAPILTSYLKNQDTSGQNGDYPPLKGVFHLAGLLDDGILHRQSWERFESVMAPKLQGAWNLHRLTAHCPLDDFVMFSSAASLLGAAGQANYAAANAFLDALAQMRQAMGLSGLSINWGAWSQVGLASRAPLSQQFDGNGVELISPQQGLAILESLCSQPAPQIGVLPIDWSQWRSPRTNWSFLAKVKAVPSEETAPESQAQFLQQLETTPERDHPLLLREHIRSQVAKVLGIDSSTLSDPQQGFTELGMDSLTSMELRNRLQSSLGSSLSSTLVYDYPTLAALTEYLVGEILPQSSHTDAQEDPNFPTTDLQELSEAEAETLLLDELKRLNLLDRDG
jgi:acyl transferase domain-containing protein/acyl-CoA synthetase (AMP-forming)/AMP-acid ligase II/acyl carrier protein